MEKGKITAEEYQAFKTRHTESCNLNTQQASPGIESEGILRLSQRSEEERGLVYRTYIGDGDSRGFAAVRDAAPYGPHRAMTKEECIGHVQNRAGSNLRALKKNLKGKNSPMGRRSVAKEG